LVKVLNAENEAVLKFNLKIDGRCTGFIALKPTLHESVGLAKFAENSRAGTHAHSDLGHVDLLGFQGATVTRKVSMAIHHVSS
jgi:hypothetical protein